jgi:hypothetical protein
MGRALASLLVGLTVLVGADALYPCASKAAASSEDHSCCEPDLAMAPSCCCDGDSEPEVTWLGTPSLPEPGASLAGVAANRPCRAVQLAHTPLFVPRPSKTVLLI